MTPRRIVAAALGAALLGGTLAATPATAQQRGYTNPLATPDRTDAGIASVAVDANRSTISVRLRTENLPDTHRVMGYLTPNRVASSGALVILDAVVVDGVVQTVVGRLIGNVATGSGGSELPDGAVTFARQGADIVLTVATKHMPWTGPVHVGGFLESDLGGGMAAVAYSDTTPPTFFGPVTTDPDATSTHLTLSAPNQPHGYSQRARLTATVTAGVPGAVTFRDGARVLGTVKVAGRQARLALPAGLTVGGHELSATFTPTDSLRRASSNAAVRFTVTRLSTSTRITLSRSSQVHLSRRTARVDVTVKRGTTGTVTIHDGRRRLATVRVRGGKASYTLSRRLAPGTHRLTATFRPSDTRTTTGSTSNTERLTVTR